MFTEYFRKFFSSANLSQVGAILDTIPRVVTDTMNAGLVTAFVRQEVDVALKQMAPLKALGPNGMPPFFYQHHWSSIGDNVSCAMLSCLNLGIIPASINHTYITLILKAKSLERVSEFKLIALCNVLYKLNPKF